MDSWPISWIHELFYFEQTGPLRACEVGLWSSGMSHWAKLAHVTSLFPRISRKTTIRWADLVLAWSPLKRCLWGWTCLFTKVLFTGPKATYPVVFFSKIGVSYLSCGPLKRNSLPPNWNMAKTRKNKKVNKGPSATWWPNFGKIFG